MSEPEKTAETPRRGSGPWYVWDIILASPLFLLGTFLHLLPLLHHREGLRNASGASLVTTCFLLLVLGLVTVIGLVVVIIRMIVTWPRHIGSRPGLWRLRLLVVLGLLAYCALPYTPFALRHKFSFIRGFEKYAKANVDISAIQAWLAEIDPNEFDKDDGDAWQKRHEEALQLPAIARLAGDARLRVVVSGEEQGRPMVYLCWFSWLRGSWGVAVGHEDMEIPETEPPRWTYYPPGTKANRYREHGEYRSQIAPGAYVWRDLD